MKNYDRINARKPENIDQRHAHILGGGIAGLATAAFLTKDGHMPATNITIYEQLDVVGGSLDGSGNAEDGYISRGERELEPYMECLWYLFGMVPSLTEEGRTVLDETRECNRDLPVNARKRLFKKDFQPRDISNLELTKSDQQRMLTLMITPESDLENRSIEEWFSSDFFESNLWYFLSSMLAFQPYHSLIEWKRYTVRFVQHLDGMEYLKGILRTKHDQYTSLILPLRTWLEEKGVKFIVNTTVSDIQLQICGNQKTVTAIELQQQGQTTLVPIASSDLVYFTNGSMTQNTCHGDNTTVAPFNDNTTHRGAFTVWEKLASRSSVFGKPEKFISTPKQSHFVSFTITIRDYPEFFNYLAHKTEGEIGSSGVVTLVDSAWFISFNLPPQPFFPNQPANVDVFWGYGLHGNNVGDYIKKPMTACTGEEILQELLYHLNFTEHFADMVPQTRIITTMLPYITSQFMPRSLHDRPQIIPAGCTNLALIGQFVELEGDVVFTVETSVRTAMIAVYRTLHLDKPIIPLFEGQYDVRILSTVIKKMLGTDSLGAHELLHIDIFDLPKLIKLAIEGFNHMPKIQSDYPEIEENS